MKNNKAADLDFIPAELLKHRGTAMIKELHDQNFKSDLVQWSTVSTEWNTGVISRLQKKGDLSNCDNWRITLLERIRK